MIRNIFLKTPQILAIADGDLSELNRPIGFCYRDKSPVSIFVSTDRTSNQPKVTEGGALHVNIKLTKEQREAQKGLGDKEWDDTILRNLFLDIEALQSLQDGDLSRLNFPIGYTYRDSEAVSVFASTDRTTGELKFTANGHLHGNIKLKAPQVANTQTQTPSQKMAQGAPPSPTQVPPPRQEYTQENCDLDIPF